MDKKEYNKGLIKRHIYNNLFEGKTLITFDSEAYRYKYKKLNKNDKNYSEEQKLAIYSIYDGNELFNGYTLTEFIEHLNYFLKKHKKIIVMAHNLNYDISLLGLRDLFIKKEKLCGLEQKYLLIEGVFYIKYSNSHGYSIEFLDSFNYFKMKLSKLAEALGEKKVADVEYMYDLENWNSYLEKNKKEICDKDTIILHRFVKHMQENQNIIWGISMSQSAFKTYLSFYIPDDLVIDLKGFNDIAIKGYRGGRNEVYDLNEFDNIRDLDVNSLYPYAMIKYKYSYRLKRKFNKDLLEADYLLDYLLDAIKHEYYNYYLNIDYKTECIRNPIMVKVKDKLIQLNEANDVWVTGREFYYLMKYTNVKYIKINEGYEFWNTDNMFSDYINIFYEYKKNARNEVEKIFYKGMLNSLYGKFGQKKSHNEFIDINKLEGIVKDFVLSHKDKYRVNVNGIVYSIYDNYITYRVQDEPKYAVLIASEISANARLINFDIQREIGFENVVYTDTDSFFVKDNVNIDKFLGNELGKCKIENEGHFKAYAPKNYIFKTKDGKIIRKLKGVKATAKELKKDIYEQDIIRVNTKHSIVAVEKVIKVDYKQSDKLKYVNGKGIIFKDVNEYMQHKEILDKKKKLRLKYEESKKDLLAFV